MWDKKLITYLIVTHNFRLKQLIFFKSIDLLSYLLRTKFYINILLFHYLILIILLFINFDHLILSGVQFI